VFFRSPPWDSVDYLALDLETSGLDPRSGKILSVGTVPVRGGAIRWGEHWYTLVSGVTREEAGGEAVGIHNILHGELADAPPIREVVAELARQLGTVRVLLVHHAPLDVGFLKLAFERTGHTWPKPAVVDTRLLVVALEERRQMLQPYARPLPRGLSELREEFDLPPFDPHHALGDALATAELFLALRARLGAKTLRHLRAR
jgi:DNA polymerase III subunit epsilon